MTLVTTPGFAQDPLEWVARAQAADPTLAALTDTRDAALARADAVETFTPQPRLGVQGWVMPLETRQGPARAQVSLSQQIPWPGTRSDQAEPHRREAEAMDAERNARALELRAEVLSVLLEIAYVDASRALHTEERDAYDDISEHMQATLAYGGGNDEAVLRAVLRAEQIADRIARLEAQRARLVIALEALVGDDAVIDAVSVAFFDATGDLDALSSRALQCTPQREALDARIARALAEGDNADHALLMAPTVGVAWTHVGRYDTPLPNTGDGGDDALMVTVSVPLPVFRSSVGHQEAALGLVSDALAHRQDALDLTQQEAWDAARATLDDETARIARFEADLIPLAEDVQEGLVDDLTHGASAHTDVLLALDDVIALRRLALDARFEARRARLALDTLACGALFTPEQPDAP